jgi:non-specific serine/threonine protein kinase/serine/threonine-protein kinase
MTPQRWQQVDELFNAALDRPAEARAAFLDEACRDDAALREQVEHYLDCHDAAGDFIEQPATAATLSLAPGESLKLEPDAMLGRQIGAYKLVRELGRGGMGAVYLAVRSDDQYQKRVALKLVKRGMDTDFILRRFRNERQILASLNHANIAQLLDGGTTEDGLPYFVMEYVEGQPITKYCDAQALSIEERLKLFRKVCSAVQYAHQNLVVHRDLKPSNILVTAEGVPKLLDFGIAKLLNPELSGQTLDPTATELRMMTPEYASPEQVRGDTVTTASDVYSLGVVLYELLSGHRPYRLNSRAPYEIVRIICEEEPPKPSVAAKSEVGSRKSEREVSEIPHSAFRIPHSKLRGDLDSIVLMAMRKEPQRRYATATQLSADIRFHLDGLPVMAHKGTLAYRAQKFVQRHTKSVALASLVVLSLLAGLIVTMWQAREARAQRARAERRSEEGRKLADLMIYRLHEEVEKLAGSTPARELMANSALEYLDGVSQEAGDNAALLIEVGDAYLKVGDVQGNPNNANLGNTAKSLQSYQKAKTLAETLARREPHNAQAQRLLALSYNKMADILAVTGKMADGLKSRQQALPIFQTLAQANLADAQAHIQLSRCYLKIGDDLGNPSYPNLGEPNQALPFFEQAMATAAALAQREPKNAQAHRYVYLSHERLADILDLIGDQAGALHHYEQSKSIVETLLTTDASNSVFRRHLAVVLDKIGIVLAQTGEAAQAVAVTRQAVEIGEALTAADPNNANARQTLETFYLHYADRLAETRDVTGALRAYRQGQTICEALMATDPASTYFQSDLADLLPPLARLLAQTGQTAEARRLATRALSIRKAHAELPAASANELHYYARNLLTVEPADLRDARAALPHAQRAVELTKGHVPRMLDTLALAHHLTGDRARAVATQQQAIALLKNDSPLRRTFETRLAQFQTTAANSR